MCGIFGVIDTERHIDRDLFLRARDTLTYRGPDAAGVWFDDTGLIGLGHRRLSIVDLSPLGNQPMHSPDGRYEIVFNGEIYNHQELRIVLEGLGYRFASKSDTEVLLAAYVAWGEECLQKLNGMFAFAVWDSIEQTLFAARDRLGEKPFKYAFTEKRFIFASELKAIRAYDSSFNVVDWQAVDLALTYRYVPAPYTGFSGIAVLPPGSCLRWHAGKVSVERYWHPARFASEKNISYSEAKKEMWELFLDSVRLRLMSDVPLGVFLSGGLDSSSVIAAMAELGVSDIRTFSVGFKDRPDSETPFAEMVAKRYGTVHTNIIIDPKIIESVRDLVPQYEQPFFDNSAVPILAMAKETKQHATVILTGDGGDEVLGGYPNYLYYRFLSRIQALPPSVRDACTDILFAFGKMTGNFGIKKAAYRSEVLAKDMVSAYVDYYGIWKERLPKTSFYLTKEDLYTSDMKSRVSLSAADMCMRDWLSFSRVPRYGAMNRAMLADIISRLPEDYLMKVDFGAMRHALETRPPFLDYRLVEYSLSLSESYKIHGSTVKSMWKDIVSPKLPKDIVHRRKMGFGIPIAHWMRHELRDFTRDRLLSPHTVFHGSVKRDVLEKLLNDHVSGKADYSNHLWSCLLLREWLDTVK